MKRSRSVEQTFERIYRRTSKYIYGLALRDTRSVADAEDIFQDTYSALLDELEKGREIHDPKSYIATILRRKLSEYYKNIARRDTRQLSEILLDYEFEDIVIEDRDIDDRLITEELIETLAEMLRRKDGTIRQIFFLRFVHELSFSEIAEKTALPVSTVKSKMYRTLEQLRKNYEEVQK